MTGNISLYIVAVLIFHKTIAVDLVSQSQEKQPDRNLASANLLDSKIQQEVFNISIESVREQIIDLHKNVKLCIDLEFAKDPSDIMPFDDIIEMCAGVNFSVVLRFYSEITFTVKEVIKEKIKAALKNGYCDNIVFMCIAYFKAIEVFIKMDYDLLKSIELSMADLERRINKDKLEYMVSVTHDQVGDYEALRQHLLDERHFLSSYFQEQKELYEAKFAHSTYIREDNLLDEEHVDNPTENMTTSFTPEDLANIDNNEVSSLLNNEGKDLGQELMNYIYHL